MTTFLTFIGIIALFIFFKFIYDTYLTNNTERDWQEYKSGNPHEERVLENNKGLNFNTDYSVRKDGIYVFRHEGVSQYGEPFKLTMLLLFNYKKRAIKVEMEGYPEIDKTTISEIIQDIAEYTILDRDCAEYLIDNGKIKMKFMNSSTHGDEYTGSVLKNGLILTRIVHYWDEMLGCKKVKGLLMITHQ